MDKPRKTLTLFFAYVCANKNPHYFISQIWKFLQSLTFSLENVTLFQLITAEFYDTTFGIMYIYILCIYTLFVIAIVNIWALEHKSYTIESRIIHLCSYF